MQELTTATDAMRQSGKSLGRLTRSLGKFQRAIMTPNIPLTRSPRPEDFEDVIGLAQKECHCNQEMKDDLKHGDEEICKTCGARQVLNGLTTLADTIE